ncbi:inverse autotransporter beta domain-containing protein [Xenorhabdus sp. Vera]|uniref:inverse autotransporter beta domain-containing protein n=1 Tax=Xenorhabdus koppenhoeferi TaxID=351659 RepID=UPI00199752B8|nr:inverse autotransporter beta domain-containing protein [Xenorhabdus sp. Vera]MBD2809590.1 inverse autotransporter beta domain-containing protein [Xenorhabdus sp. Vera]
MPSYLSKIIVSFIALYTLLIPSTMTTALAEGNLTDNDIYSQKINTKNNIDIPVSESSNRLLISNTHKEANIGKNSDTSNSDTPNIIARNIHAVSNILSSSPKELTEHAKSYALSKLNNTVTSEVQKWLSQFGTTRINFGLDKKGTLENTSLDLLLPIYDNKADWLFFSQFGYRNKDSRNTVNVGLGGRYFYQNWMYGLNTFYDHDLTGKNQRLGMGGEIWGDYIKLSANAYYGLSDWKKSQHLHDYHERPANGYDINGEFFLPAYPNLGAKLAYEQYFGDNVTLFNRDTKQKNPSLATLGLNYTPIPLFTMGVDYKQGESGHTETQFLANLNYKLGVPLHVQLSPDSVASMRTLAGSRYDLVERNNQIILDHQKRSTLQLSLPEVMTGYSHEEQVVTVTNNPSDKVDWLQQNNDFIKNGGKISLNAGNKMTITFPEYQLNTGGINTYPLNFTVSESSNLQQTHHATIQVIVRPFLIKEKEVQPDAGVVADGKTPYIFTPVMTYDTVNHIPLPKDVPLNHIKWTTEPPVGEESGLSWGKPEPTSTTNEKGQLQAALVSSKPQKEVNVFLQMDGMAKTQIGTVSFDDDPAGYHIKGELTVNKKSPLIANGHDDYTFTGTVFDAQNNPVKKTKISQVKWFIKQNGTDESQNQNLIFKPLGDTTNESGELTATLASHKEIKDLQVSLSIKGDAPTIEAPHPVSFIADIAGYRVQDITVTPTGTLTADGRSQFHYTATIVDINDNHRAVTDAEIKNVAWSTNQKEDNSLILVPIKEGDIFKTDGSGQLKATLASKTFIGDVRVSLTIENQPPFNAEQVSFTTDPSKYKIKELIVDPQKPMIANGLNPFTYTAVVLDGDGNVLKNKEINQVKWKITRKGQDVSDDKQLVFHPQTGTVKTDKDGKLTAQLASHEPRENLLVSLSIENHKDVDANQLVSFIIDPSTIRTKGGKLDMEPSGPLAANGEASYTFTATVIDSIDNKPLGKQDIKNVKWRIMQNETKDVTDNPKFTFSAPDGDVTTKDDGTLQATLKSTEALDGLTVQLSFENQIKAKSPAFAFIPDPKTYQVKKIDISPDNPLPLTATADSNPKFTYTAVITDANDNLVKDTEIGNVEWKITQHSQDVSHDNRLIFNPQHGSVKTGNDGQLTAQVAAHKPIKDLLASLAIEKKQPVEIDQKYAVSFEPEKISAITVDPPSPILVNETYTLSVKISDATGQPEIGKTVNWTIKSPNQNAIKPDPTSTTNGQGEATTTLTSSQAQTVTVTASVDGIKSQPIEVEFKWPTVKEIKLNPPNGTVLHGGEYDFTATIVGADGKSEYSGSGFKFKWEITKPTDPTASGLSLTPAEADSVSGGVLKTTLKSDANKPAAQNVEVCLNVVGAGEASPPGKCISAINFATPPADFEIKSIEVTPSTTPLTGNGTDHITYKALIIKKNAGGKPEPIKEHTFTNVSWAIDDKHNKIKELKLSPSLYERRQYTTDKDGYLIATLSSSENVGVDKVFVKLTVEEGQYHHSAQSKPENFEPVPKPAVLFVYNKNNKQVNKIFHEPAPYFFFDSLNAELRAADKQNNSFDQNELSYSVDNVQTAPIADGQLVNIQNGDKGPISFYNPGNGRLKATITKEDGRVYLYTYEINLRTEIFYASNPIEFSGYHPKDDQYTCEQYPEPPNSVKILSLTHKQALKKYGRFTLGNEFENLLKWGLFGENQHGTLYPVHPDNVSLKIATDDSRTSYEIYDPIRDQVNRGPEGLVICTTENDPIPGIPPKE